MANFIHCLGVVWGFLVFIRIFFVGDKDSENRAKTQVYLRFSEVQPIFRQRSSLKLVQGERNAKSQRANVKKKSLCIIERGISCSIYLAINHNGRPKFFLCIVRKVTKCPFKIQIIALIYYSELMIIYSQVLIIKT